MTPRTLVLLPGRLGVCRISPEQPLPAWAESSTLCSMTRTADELSIVCDEHRVPGDVRCERSWRALRVAGTLELSIVGLLADLTATLAAGGVSVFALSTFDTDYLLFKEDRLEAAVRVLEGAGHRVERSAS